MKGTLIDCWQEEMNRTEYQILLQCNVAHPERCIEIGCCCDLNFSHNFFRQRYASYTHMHRTKGHILIPILISDESQGPMFVVPESPSSHQLQTKGRLHWRQELAELNEPIIVPWRDLVDLWFVNGMAHQELLDEHVPPVAWLRVGLRSLVRVADALCLPAAPTYG